jgi:hypothetical protein
VAKPRMVIPSFVAAQGVDMAQVPLDYNFKAAVGSDPKKAQKSIRVLGCAIGHGRIDAAVFLVGLLGFLREDDWETRIVTVENLASAQSEYCAKVLFSELRRVKSSNTTRRYINAILDVLERFPSTLTHAEFESLASDVTFARGIRDKSRAIADRLALCRTTSD